MSKKWPLAAALVVLALLPLIKSRARPHYGAPAGAPTRRPTEKPLLSTDEHAVPVRVVRSAATPPRAPQRWLEKAAELGHANAQYALALLYGKGERVPQDLHESEKWARRAADRGHEGAKRILEILLRRDASES
jgi:TPR repeat protein